MSRVVHAEMAAQISAEMRAFDASLDLLDHAAAAAFGISRTDLRAMELVSRKGSATAGQLAEELHLTTGAVTGLIDRMEKVGYFQRQDDPGDRRKVVVQLTAEGRERERWAYEPLGREAARSLSRYKPEELVIIRDFLRLGRAQVDAAIARLNGASPRDAAAIRKRT